MKNQNQQIELCAAFACIMEATAPKPGNVHPNQDFPDLKYLHFLGSANAIAPIMGRAIGRPVGETILSAVEATQRVRKTNTNLGIVLLLAPLATVADDGRVRSGIKGVLENLTIDDARLTYEAIRLANPGGLGSVNEQDVHNEPTVNLREAMELAADRDLIAAQYVNGFADVFAGFDWLQEHAESPQQHRSHLPFQFITPNLNRLIVDLYFWFLSRHPDSLIMRKRGRPEAIELQTRAAALLKANEKLRDAHIRELNDWFAAEFPHRNPGTTADLVCASLFVALRTGIIPLPEIPDEYLKEP